ncbi:oxidoreductase [Spirochaetia bacterium]|nr:oxidoreductase [Spirochaetia bacterium]
MIKSVIIGLGDIAPVHLAAIASYGGAALAAACDTDPARQKILPPGTPFFTDYRAMLNEVRPDVVHITLPHYLHYPVAKEAAEAGFNVFAEKPLALNYADGLEYAKLEEKTGVKICICLQNRLNATSEKLREILLSDAYGKITGVRGLVAWKRAKQYYDDKPWRALMAKAGGGNMINQALHTLDLMQYFAGAKPKQLRGIIGQLLDYGIEVEDTAAAFIEFENGVTGLFNGSNANAADVPAEIEVICEKATFTIRYQTLYRRDSGGETRLAEDAGSGPGKAVYGNSHEKLIARFYQVLETGSGEYIHPADALPVTWLIEAIRESGLSGKTVRF